MHTRQLLSLARRAFSVRKTPSSSFCTWDMSDSSSVSSMVPADEAATTVGTTKEAEEVIEWLAWWPHLIDTSLLKGKKSVASEAGRWDSAALCIAKPNSSRACILNDKLIDGFDNRVRPNRGATVAVGLHALDDIAEIDYGLAHQLDIPIP